MLPEEGYASVADGYSILIHGGKTKNGASGDIFRLEGDVLSTVHCSGVAPRRCNHAAAINRDLMYVVHGSDQRGEYKPQVLPVLDLTSSTWFECTTHGDVPDACTHHTVTTRDEKLYLCGGLSNSPSSVFELDCQANNWRAILTGPSPFVWGHATVLFRNLLVNIGGTAIDTGEASPNLWMYHTTEHEWRSSQCGAFEARYNFSRTDSRQMDLRKGDSLIGVPQHQIRDKGPAGWVKVRRGHESGWCPENHLRRLYTGGKGFAAAVDDHSMLVHAADTGCTLLFDLERDEWKVVASPHVKGYCTACQADGTVVVVCLSTLAVGRYEAGHWLMSSIRRERVLFDQTEYYIEDSVSQSVASSEEPVSPSHVSARAPPDHVALPFIARREPKKVPMLTRSPSVESFECQALSSHPGVSLKSPSRPAHLRFTPPPPHNPSYYRQHIIRTPQRTPEPRSTTPLSSPTQSPERERHVVKSLLTPMR
eukprot:TRINITY_DN33942_c0_g1_i1.p1 TRINITY_DN33942_c0_g1~~TRINITY_DN33942_c0_g1_i1.p1  ORF type:complete len:480 (+),score=46.16 TRINITY_DN33942_c0_g1_i1:39-1478(+)